MTHYIENAVDTKQLGGYIANFKRFKNYIKQGKEGFTKSAYSAYRERSLGLGAMGFHAYLQSKKIPFESSLLRALTIRHLALLKIQPPKLLKDLAIDVVSVLTFMGQVGEMLTSWLLLLMLASGIICSGTSPSIEPFRANCYTHKTLSGSYQVKNKYLEKLLKSKKVKSKKLEAIWKDIFANEGSVQQLDILNDQEKEIFKTANEINQIWIVEHAYQRQQYICQAQSVNLFFTLPKTTEAQEIHDDYIQVCK